MNNWDIAFTIFIIAAVFALGWSGSELYEDFSNEREINGLYISNADNISVARSVAKVLDEKGDFVCINVAYDMTFEEAIRTCNHECQHKAFDEIWAEKCEDDFDGCLEYLGGYVNTSNG